MKAADSACDVTAIENAIAIASMHTTYCGSPLRAEVMAIRAPG